MTMLLGNLYHLAKESQLLLGMFHPIYQIDRFDNSLSLYFVKFDPPHLMTKVITHYHYTALTTIAETDHYDYSIK